MTKIAPVILIAAGFLGLAYGGLGHRGEMDDVDAGPVPIAVDADQRTNLPMWAGFGSILLGGFLLIRRRNV